jgi:phosphoserine phosphatase
LSPLPALALFDLDHTLLDGDSDVLWCEFLIDRGLLDRATFAPRNACHCAGHMLVLTTATNLFLTEPSAAALGFEHLIATECAFDADGRFSGRVEGTPNMRDGKVARLRAWLAARGRALEDGDSVFYSDSINDLPLLLQVRQPIVVDADPRLQREAQARGWQALCWRTA